LDGRVEHIPPGRFRFRNSVGEISHSGLRRNDARFLQEVIQDHWRLARCICEDDGWRNLMEYVLALDQGTTSSRAVLFGHDGKIVGVAQHEFQQHFPDTGWVEHDPFDILTSQLTSAVEVLGKAGVRPRDIVGLGITNQRETTIVWDRETGKPVYNAIVWQDRRGAPLCKRLSDDGAEDTIRQKTGLLIDPYFSATKIAWILDNVQGARERAERGKLAFGTVDSWLVWNLTSGKRHITDRTNASRTMLYNIVEDKWDEDLLKMLNLPASMMPEVCWSSDRMGRVTTSLGLGDVEIAGIAGDQQSALFGQLCVSPGDAKNTYGTGCFLLQNIGSKFTLSKERLITTLTCSTAKKLEYALEGSIFVGGAVVQWLRDNMRFFKESPDVESVAASVESAGNVVFVPAFTGLGAPHWDPYASGMIIGIERGTEIGHIARAALESIAFQVADVLIAMNQDTQQPFRELRVDGGAAANDILMQFQSDLLQLPVRRPAILETTALGAAYLAGLSVGFWENTEEIAKFRAEDTVFEPKADKKEMEARQAKWQDAVKRAGGWNRKQE
jgi:glycerol kinase